VQLIPSIYTAIETVVDRVIAPAVTDTKEEYAENESPVSVPLAFGGGAIEVLAGSPHRAYIDALVSLDPH
jgi:hypothetical protein